MTKLKLDFGGVEPGDNEIRLPFKPFTTDEIMAITGVNFAVLDHWLNMQVGSEGCLLPMQVGEDANQSRGLSWFQTFAVFVGNRFIHEGAPRGRAEQMVRAVQRMTVDYLVYNFDRGDTFYVPQAGQMVKQPKGALGARLNLQTLYNEFLERVKKVFPEDKTSDYRDKKGG